MNEQQLYSNISLVRERIAHAAIVRAEKTGVIPNVTLVAATKTVPAETIGAAIKLGITDVGENRAQELKEKYDFVHGADWHFIGSLQSNKAKYLVGKVKLIQSVSSVALAEEIARLCAVRNVTQDVLVEVNVGGETSKTGADVNAVEDVVNAVTKSDRVNFRGIMAILPIGADDGMYKTAFEIYSRYAQNKVDILSMGMSGDYEKAILFGSNMVRVGSSIFGQRNNR
ncbi:MAG: YggS family pyridoxal phosphate-dependent enzyme [Clostridiales bacterium]|nr:YggS family pyridoxal phosphate-dependent enzyme [Clostridiales bacterium]